MGKVYCMSDIHGNKACFLKMLDKIKFTEEDVLYILGDIFDCGSDPLGLYEEIKSRANVVSLLGNHDAYLAKSILYHKENPVSACHLKLILQDAVSEEKLDEIAQWIKNMELQVKLTLDGIDYLLAHAQTSDDPNVEDPLFFAYGKYVDRTFHANGVCGYISVVGHFDTWFLRYAMKEEPVTPNTIWVNQKGNVYVIDCGNEQRSKRKGMRLGCLRLNDKKCFYV